MAGAEATETFQTVKTRLRCQIDQNLIPQMEAKTALQAINSQVSHKADQCPLTREDFKAVVIPLGTTLGRRPREDLKAILIPEKNLTKT